MQRQRAALGQQLLANQACPHMPEANQDKHRREDQQDAPEKVREVRTVKEAISAQGRSPITVRWVDVNKGDDESPNYRSRLVAREIRRKGEAPVFVLRY